MIIFEMIKIGVCFIFLFFFNLANVFIYTFIYKSGLQMLKNSKPIFNSISTFFVAGFFFKSLCMRIDCMCHN